MSSYEIMNKNIKNIKNIKIYTNFFILYKL